MRGRRGARGMDGDAARSRSRRRWWIVAAGVAVAVVAILAVALAMQPTGPQGHYEVLVGTATCNAGTAAILGSFSWVGSPPTPHAVVTVHLWVLGTDEGTYAEPAASGQGPFTITVSVPSCPAPVISDRVTMVVVSTQYI